MKDKHFNDWGKIRARGMKHYVFYVGVLQWGLSMFLLMTFVLPILQDMRDLFFGDDNFFLALIVLIVFALIISFLWGQSIQQLFEKKYLNSVLWASAVLGLIVFIYLLTGAVALMSSVSIIFINLIVYGIGGFFFGVGIWASNEGRYEKEFERREQDGRVA